MAISELIFLGLNPKRIALKADDPAEPQIFITELFRRIEIMLPFFGVNLNFLSDRIVAFDILYDG